MNSHLQYELPRYRQRPHERLVEMLAKMTVEYLPSAGTPILDVGCGRGELMHTLSDRGYILSGFDVDDECLQLSRSFGSTYSVNIDSIPLATASQFKGAFDLVVASHVVEHLHDPVAALRAMGDLTTNYVLLAVPNPHSVMTTLATWAGVIRRVNQTHVAIWDRSHFANLLRNQLGWTIVKWATDWVQFVPWQLHRYIYRVPGFDALEMKLLPRIFPYAGESIIVLCSTVGDTSTSPEEMTH